jgi:hypothetical protein
MSSDFTKASCIPSSDSIDEYCFRTKHQSLFVSLTQVQPTQTYAALSDSQHGCNSSAGCSLDLHVPVLLQQTHSVSTCEEGSNCVQ